MSINYSPRTPPKKSPPVNYGLFLTVGSQVGLATIGIILFALIVGLGLDELLETTKHPFTILLFLGSVPFSLLVIYWLAKRTTEKINSQSPAQKQSEPVEEEQKRG